VPSSTVQALAMVRAGLGYLSCCDAAELGTAAQAEALIGWSRPGRSTRRRGEDAGRVQRPAGHQADGQYGPAAWLRLHPHHPGAAGSAVKWARRLAAHPLTAAALAAGS